MQEYQAFLCQLKTVPLVKAVIYVTVTAVGNHQILIEKCHLDDCMNNFPRNFPVTRLFVYLFVFKELHPPPPRIFDGVTLARELIRNVIVPRTVQGYKNQFSSCTKVLQDSA